MLTKEIKCPNCGTPIQIDESTYDSIAKQIRDEEFSNEITRQKAEAVKLAQAQTESSMKDKLAEKDEKILELQKKFEELRTKANTEFIKKDAEKKESIAEKDKQILELQNALSKQELNEKTAIANAVSQANTKIATLQSELDANNNKYKAYIDKVNADNQLELVKKDKELNALQAALKEKDSEKELELNKATYKSAEEINELKNQILSLNEQFRTKEESLISTYEFQLKAKQDEVDAYKDFKAKQSTKAIGEDLEVYCMNQFNKLLRPILPNCYFEKDNEVSKETNSKGDFIFRDFDTDGVEIVSVMIECKNEADATEKKHKNEDFFKELDKDRKEKKCEYAILCTTLEADNDLYNEGIVDVSYKFDKMYVVRPQQLIPLLTLLRSSSLKALSIKKELILAQTQNIDIANFEDNMNAFKEGFSKNYELASRKFKNAIDEIDKSIDHLQKIKDSLLSSENNLRLANSKAQDLSIKKLTHNAPSVKSMFEKGKPNN